jgi:hypothetical protein
MPMYGSYLQRSVADIFNNLDDTIDMTFDENNISDLLHSISKIDATLKIFRDAWMDMEYCGNYRQFYDDFASKHHETHLLKESNYVIFDLDEYFVNTLSGDSYDRNWIYEYELSLIIDKLHQQKIIINKHITQFDVRAAIALALLKL